MTRNCRLCTQMPRRAYLDQVRSILPALELIPLDCGVTSRGGATPMQAKWIELDLGYIIIMHT